MLGVGEAPISISSSPSRSNGTFELCVRKVGDVTSAIHRLKPGSFIGIRGPFGRGFPIEKFRGKDMLFAPGGLGLAPLRSLINQVLDERAMFGRVLILYGARNPSEMLFKDELARWANRPDIELHTTVDKGDDTWTGQRRGDHHPLQTVIHQPAQHGRSHLRSARHVSLCFDGVLRKRDFRRQYLPVSRAPHEVRCGKMRSLPDQ